MGLLEGLVLGAALVNFLSDSWCQHQELFISNSHGREISLSSTDLSLRYKRWADRNGMFKFGMPFVQIALMWPLVAFLFLLTGVFEK